MVMSHFIYLFIVVDIWLSTFWLLEQCCYKHSVQVFVLIPIFFSLESIPREGPSGCCGISMFNLLRNHQTLLHSDCPIIYLNRQCLSFSTFSPFPVFFLFCFAVVIPVCLTRYLIGLSSALFQWLMLLSNCSCTSWLPFLYLFWICIW